MQDIKSMVKGTRYDISDLVCVHSDGREFYCRLEKRASGSGDHAAILKDTIDRTREARGGNDMWFERWLERLYGGTATGIILSENSAFHVENIPEQSMQYMWGKVESFAREKLEKAKADSEFAKEFKAHLEED